MQDLAGAKVPALFSQRGQPRFAWARQIPLTETGRAQTQSIIFRDARIASRIFTLKPLHSETPMGKISPLAVAERTAAKMMDMAPAQFRELVAQGVLPRPRKVGPLERWDAEELRSVMRGDFVDGYEDVQW
jgi:hypothetical protein